MRRVRILEQVTEEAIESAAWYEQERPGLGIEFERAINAAGARGIKRLALRRFPYDIVVRVLAHEIIIVAIAHQSRRPGYWRDRLRT